MYRFKKKLGDSYVEIEADSIKRLFAECAQIPALSTCVCGSAKISPSHRNVAGNDYFSIRCQDCGAEYKMGQSKDTVSLFFKGDTQFVKYQGKSDQVTEPKSDGVPW